MAEFALVKRTSFFSEISDNLSQNWKQLLIVISLNIFARGQMLFNPMYSIDSYSLQVNRHVDAYLTTFISQGRFGMAALMWTTDRLGFFGIDVGVSSGLTAVVLFTFSGFILSTIIFENPTKTENLIFASLFTLHPYMTELYHFSHGTFAFAIATALAAVGSKLFLGSWRQIGCGIILSAIGISVYQTAIAFVLPVWFLAIAKILAMKTSEKASINLRTKILGLCFAILSVIVYVIFIRIYAAISGIPLGAYADTTSVLNYKEKLQLLPIALRLSFWSPSSIMPTSIVITIITTLIFCVLRLLAELLGRLLLIRILACAICVAASLGLAVGLTSMGGNVWIVARTLTPIAAFEAGVIGIGWHLSTRAGRRFISIALGVVLIGFIGASNRILRDQWRVNFTDMQQIGRIINRLEQSDKFSFVRTVVIDGKVSGRPEPISTQWGNLNESAIEVPWSQQGLIEEATGYTFGSPTASDRSAGQTYCAQHDKWPAPVSTVIIGDIGIVCLRQS